MLGSSLVAERSKAQGALVRYDSSIKYGVLGRGEYVSGVFLLVTT